LCILVYVDETTQSLLEQVTTAIDRQFGSYLQVILILGTECDATVFEVARRVAQVSAKYTVVSRSYVSNEMAPISVGTNIVCLLGAILLREHALYMLARAAASLGAVDLVYSDEDTLDVDGNRCKPIFKPQFSPTLARQLNYIGRCFLVREVDCGPIEIARRLSDGTLTTDQYVESILKRATTIVHVPDVLYHDITPLRAAPKRSIDLIGPGKVLPTFSVIILTRDLVEFLKPCIESIENRTDYPHSKIEIIVVDNGSSDKNTLEYLETLSGDRRATVIRDASRFNYSGLNNAGAAAAKHDVLLFINNDMLVDDPLWLRRIATHVTEHDVAAVGAKLLFPDRRIQHAGVILGIRGVAGHNLVGLDESDPRVRGDMTRELSAVTGACLSIRRDVFNQLGGFDTVTAVAFNDVLLCLAAIKAGYRNVYIKEPLLIHFESRSRGQDNTAKKAAWFGREARYALKRYPEFFRNDPYYSPNLCLQEPNTLAFPPRRSKPWRGTTRDLTRLKILFLSSTHEIGHGVAVVLALQANHLRARGHDVSVGGPKGQAEVSYGDCRRVYLNTPAEAAAVAVEMGIDCIVAETPPFFSVTRWLDQWPRTFCLDYGEPPSEFFPDAAARQKVVAEKQLCFAAASKVAAISRSVRAEGTEERAQVIPLGNSHLIGVKGQSRQQRESMRQRFGWVDKAIILNVCRFTAAERYYKGLTEYEEILQEFRFARPNLAGRTVFVLCGKGTLEDASAMRQCGFEVFPNVSDVEMADLYNAADIYANFSRWEGYNLGIGQALAAGLPVVASDIPAHRAFSVFTSNDTLTTVEKLSELVQTAIEHQFSAERVPTVWDWKHSLEKLEDEIVQLCRT
jgi:GT2 family glycosyltransferase/glycosyltransferase involved in cell wall biosynthesis